MRTQTIERDWVMQKPQRAEDLYGAINKKRIQEADSFRDSLYDKGFTPDKYEIKLRHLPCSDAENGDVTGIIMASITKLDNE